MRYDVNRYCLNEKGIAVKATIDLNGDRLTAEYIVEAAQRASAGPWGPATLVQYSQEIGWEAMLSLRLPWYMRTQVNVALEHDEILLCAHDNTALGRIINFTIEEDQT